jgi:hypothetical protein
MEKNTRREDLGRGHELLVIQEGRLVGTAVRWVPCQKFYPSPVQQMQLSKYARCGTLRFSLCGCRFVLIFERSFQRSSMEFPQAMMPTSLRPGQWSDYNSSCDSHHRISNKLNSRNCTGWLASHVEIYSMAIWICLHANAAARPIENSDVS